MEFKIGDKVAALDLDMEGIVKSVKGTEIMVETTDGFVIAFSSKELIKYKKTSGLKEVNSIFNLNQIKHEKEIPVKRKPAPVQKVKGEIPPPEIDLHIEKLVKNFKRMSNHDILTLQTDAARYRIELAIRNRTPKIIFIHGVGDGVLKAELDFLLSRYSNVSFRDADYRKYGVGATEVTFKQNVK